MTIDLIVVGSGSAAQSVAYPCRHAGWSVMVIDSRPLGGTCSQRGCDPKKVLVGISELADWSRRMQGKGFSAPAATMDWSDMMRFKETFTENVPSSTEAELRDAGIVAVRGRAQFAGPRSLRVDGETHDARHVVIAAGARHAPLGIPGEEELLTSTGFLELEALPRRVAFVGGGYIAFEFAHVAARGGAAVQVIHRGDRPLEGFDADLVDDLVTTTRDLGVDVQLRTTVVAVEKRGDEFIVRTRCGDEHGEIVCDLVVHAAGRVPEIDDLALEAADVERVDGGGIAVNEYLQSVSNPAVYAAGDAVASGGLPLTPVADMQGGIVAANLIDGNTRTPNYEGIPSMVFTTPSLARVGLDETTARARGLRFTVRREDTSSWYSSRRVALDHTGYKTLVEDGTQRILGAHVLGPNAEEIINIFGLAIRKGLSAGDLKDMIYAYPTGGSDISSMV
ncbi:MAG TPA: NAD(P)/FAD-dependent oxidoreductase [Acidimicrobiales bacterium]|jgi:glutathione reductase (NADPH)